MFSCEPVKNLTSKLIHILKIVGLLRLGDNIEMFLFYEYAFDTVENLVLITNGTTFINLDLILRNTPSVCLSNILKFKLTTSRLSPAD